MGKAAEFGATEISGEVGKTLPLDQSGVRAIACQRDRGHSWGKDRTIYPLQED